MQAPRFWTLRLHVLAASQVQTVLRDATVMLWVSLLMLEWSCVTSKSPIHQYCMTACMHKLCRCQQPLALRMQLQTVAPGFPAASSACTGQWFCAKCSLLAVPLHPLLSAPPLLSETFPPHVLCFQAGLPQVAYVGCLAPQDCHQYLPQLQSAISNPYYAAVQRFHTAASKQIVAVV